MSNMVGLYSAKADSLFGHFLYETPEGKTVVVTAVYNKGDEHSYEWDDKIVIGPLSRFIRDCRNERK